MVTWALLFGSSLGDDPDPTCWAQSELESLRSMPRAGSGSDATVCAGGNPPRVAFVVAGVARGFERSLMHHSFRRNVVEAFTLGGGAPHDVFVALKNLGGTPGADSRPDIATHYQSLELAVKSLHPARVGNPPLVSPSEATTSTPNPSHRLTSPWQVSILNTSVDEGALLTHGGDPKDPSCFDRLTVKVQSAASTAAMPKRRQ